MPQLVPFSKSDLVNFLACLHLVLLFIIVVVVVDGDDGDVDVDVDENNCVLLSLLWDC